MITRIRISVRDKYMYSKKLSYACENGECDIVDEMLINGNNYMLYWKY